jgi:hypothetical protein
MGDWSCQQGGLGLSVSFARARRIREDSLSFPKIPSGVDSHPKAVQRIIKSDVCDSARALGRLVSDLFKSRCRLEAENLLLRHQLSIALRRFTSHWKMPARK